MFFLPKDTGDPRLVASAYGKGRQLAEEAGLLVCVYQGCVLDMVQVKAADGSWEEPSQWAPAHRVVLIMRAVIVCDHIT